MNNPELDNVKSGDVLKIFKNSGDVFFHIAGRKRNGILYSALAIKQGDELNFTEYQDENISEGYKSIEILSDTDKKILSENILSEIIKNKRLRADVVRRDKHVLERYSKSFGNDFVYIGAIRYRNKRREFYTFNKKYGVITV